VKSNIENGCSGKATLTDNRATLILKMKEVMNQEVVIGTNIYIFNKFNKLKEETL